MIRFLVDCVVLAIVLPLMMWIGTLIIYGTLHVIVLLGAGIVSLFRRDR
jgi:hypothetical protein